MTVAINHSNDVGKLGIVGKSIDSIQLTILIDEILQKQINIKLLRCPKNPTGKGGRLIVLCLIFTYLFHTLLLNEKC